jgi:hypothetical protein
VSKVYEAFRYRPELFIDFDGTLESAKDVLEVLNGQVKKDERNRFPADRGKGPRYTAILREDGQMAIVVKEHMSSDKEFAVAPAVIRLSGEYHRPEAIPRDRFEKQFRPIPDKE